MSQSDQIDQLATALAKAQREIKNPAKNKKVKVRTKTGGTYEFEYADLTAITDAIKEPLSNNGLSFVQLVGGGYDGKWHLTTMLFHSSGQWVGEAAPLIISEEGSNQSFGSAVTFMKRYTLAAMLGISADSDDDANVADGNEATITDRQRKPKPPAPSPIRGSGPQADPVQKSPIAAIAVPLANGSKDWMAWGRAFMIAAQAAEASDKTELLYLNQDNLKKMKDEAPKMFPRLEAALKEVYTGLILEEGN